MKRRNNPLFNKIINEVCKAYSISNSEFHSKRRVQEIAVARFHYWHILWKVHNMGLSQIGRQAGYTHGSIFNGIKNINYELRHGCRSFQARHKLICDALDITEHYKVYEPVFSGRPQLVED